MIFHLATDKFANTDSNSYHSGKKGVSGDLRGSVGQRVMLLLQKMRKEEVVNHKKQDSSIFPYILPIYL